jgi:hypothetical protein
MNNAVLGKTMENLPKRLIVQLVNNQAKARKLTSKPTFHAGHSMFSVTFIFSGANGYSL